MPIFTDVTRFNDNIPGLKTVQDNDGDIRMTYTPGGSGEPVFDVNFSNMARRVLAIFGLKEPKMEKYGVENRQDLWQKELAQVQAEIKTIESNGPALTKEASGRLKDLRSREDELVDAMRGAADKH